MTKAEKNKMKQVLMDELEKSQAADVYTQATLTPLPKTVRPRVVIPHPPTPLRFVYGFNFINSAPTTTGHL